MALLSRTDLGLKFHDRVRINEEIRRRTRVVRIFPNRESRLRLVRALGAETHESWLEEHRYLKMQLLAEHKREQLREMEEVAA